ncbi:MAG: hypothetical protein IKZ49_04045 [Alphaproteobacteria bacterium]|nr:hypothetical protein [Alphaproteobacteria bacterium]
MNKKNEDIILDSNFDSQLAMWCNRVEDTNDLAGMADKIIQLNVDTISAYFENISDLWPWLENSGIKLYTRFDFAPTKFESDFNDLIKKINSVCKTGAGGVQIFLNMRNFDRFIDNLSVVRDDLFYNRDLSICVDINEIDINNLAHFFEKLRSVSCSVLGITLNKDTKKKSDFMTRIYALLNEWDFDGVLHCINIENKLRICQVMRLTETIKPDIYDELRFFIEY